MCPLILRINAVLPGFSSLLHHKGAHFTATHAEVQILPSSGGTCMNHSYLRKPLHPLLLRAYNEL